jgi:hypothetical protein
MRINKFIYKTYLEKNLKQNLMADFYYSNLYMHKISRNLRIKGEVILFKNKINKIKSLYGIWMEYLAILNPMLRK